MSKKSIVAVTRAVISLLKINKFFIEMSRYMSEEDFVDHNNRDTINIDSTGIKLYNTEDCELTDEQLDKQLIDFIRHNEPDVIDFKINIEREINFKDVTGEND